MEETGEPKFDPMSHWQELAGKATAEALAQLIVFPFRVSVFYVAHDFFTSVKK